MRFLPWTLDPSVAELLVSRQTRQGALKLVLEPIFEADFQPGSFRYRFKRTAHEAVDRVARAIVQHKTRVIDIDLRRYFDNVRHDRLFSKVARRVDDADVMHLLKIMLKANGQGGVPQSTLQPNQCAGIRKRTRDRLGWHDALVKDRCRPAEPTKGSESDRMSVLVAHIDQGSQHGDPMPRDRIVNGVAPLNELLN